MTLFEGHFSFGYRLQEVPVPDVLYELPVSYLGNPASFIGPDASRHGPPTRSGWTTSSSSAS